MEKNVSCGPILCRAAWRRPREKKDSPPTCWNNASYKKRSDRRRSVRQVIITGLRFEYNNKNLRHRFKTRTRESFPHARARGSAHREPGLRGDQPPGQSRREPATRGCPQSPSSLPEVADRQLRPSAAPWLWTGQTGLPWDARLAPPRPVVGPIFFGHQPPRPPAHHGLQGTVFQPQSGLPRDPLGPMVDEPGDLGRSRQSPAEPGDLGGGGRGGQDQAAVLQQHPLAAARALPQIFSAPASTSPRARRAKHKNGSARRCPGAGAWHNSAWMLQPASVSIRA